MLPDIELPAIIIITHYCAIIMAADITLAMPAASSSFVPCPFQAYVWLSQSFMDCRLRPAIAAALQVFENLIRLPCLPGLQQIFFFQPRRRQRHFVHVAGREHVDCGVEAQEAMLRRRPCSPAARMRRCRRRRAFATIRAMPRRKELHRQTRY